MDFSQFKNPSESWCRVLRKGYPGSADLFAYFLSLWPSPGVLGHHELPGTVYLRPPKDCPEPAGIRPLRISIEDGVPLLQSLAPGWYLGETQPRDGITSVSWTGSIYATATPSIVASSEAAGLR